jgi:hypothetical protein
MIFEIGSAGGACVIQSGVALRFPPQSILWRLMGGREVGAGGRRTSRNFSISVLIPPSGGPLRAGRE